MEANELRIGNWVQGIKRGCFTKLESIADIEKAIKLKCKPIKLSGQILMKMGFEKILSDQKSGATYWLWIDEAILIYEDDFSIAICSDESQYRRGGYIVPDMKIANEVHKLQNLVYALSRKELDFQLK